MATLDTVKGVNRTLQEAVPSSKLDVSLNYGKLRVLYDSYTVASADEFGTDGLIRLFTIPKGARLIDFETSCATSATTGQYHIGWAASSDGVETADADGIMATVDPGNAPVARQKMTVDAAGYMKKFASAVEVQADFIEASGDLGAERIDFLAIIAVE